MNIDTLININRNVIVMTVISNGRDSYYAWNALEIDILYNSQFSKPILNKRPSFLDRRAKLIQI